MKSSHKNAFFIFGMVVLAIMLTQLDYQQVWSGLQHAGYWTLAVVLLWALLYILNTAAWYIIINAGERTKVKFWWLYKIMVSGFALNYATPGGLVGGEPYRIMALSPIIGTERASSSVILHVMTHIFSHFWFWMLSIILYLFIHPLNTFMATILGLAAVFCVLGLWFFIVGYRKGLAVRAMRLLQHMPLIRRWATRFINRHRQQLDTIDTQIAALHKQNRKLFVTAVGLELSCRIISALEIYFILRILMPHVGYADCILILAFTSLFANLLFFLPLQLGGREGGFLMSVSGLGMTASSGVFVALIVRLRELLWTGIGLMLIKIDKSPKDNDAAEQ
jgi:uncharacterized membrane protein YbhN (UPF0104 family)